MCAGGEARIPDFGRLQSVLGHHLVTCFLFFVFFLKCFNFFKGSDFLTEEQQLQSGACAHSQNLGPEKGGGGVGILSSFLCTYLSSVTPGFAVRKTSVRHQLGPELQLPPDILLRVLAFQHWGLFSSPLLHCPAASGSQSLFPSRVSPPNKERCIKICDKTRRKGSTN